MQQATFGRRGVSAPRSLIPLQSSSLALEPEPLPATPGLSYQDLSGTVETSAGVVTDETDMMRYVGGNWPKYRELWRSMKGSAELKTSFSFAAFFFSTFWLLYRKLYAWAFGIFGVGLAVSFILPHQVWLFHLATSVALGFKGKALVVQRGMSTVENLKSMGLSSGEAALRVEKTGGTNLPAVLGLVLVSMIVGVAGAAKQQAAKKNPAAAIRSMAIQRAL